MDKKTRVRLSLAVVDCLSDQSLSFQATNLILRTYGLETLGDYADGPSLHDIVSWANDEQLIEIAEYFELEVPHVAAPKSQVPTIGTARPLRIFGSHLSDHKVLVGAVREQLLRYGIDLFVAHDTIEHDKLWQDEIEKALGVADAGLVFVHDGLRKSAWCDQEIGWLLGREVPVMALRFDETPYGFFAKFQAQPVPIGASAATIAEMVVDRVATKPELAAGFAASLVSAMASSWSFATTDAIWKRLRELSSLDADLCSQLLKATKENTQIHWAKAGSDGGQPYSRVVTEFIRRQPGAAVITSDIQAYVDYLDEKDAEMERRNDETRRRLEQQLASQDPFA
ncbi:TIR domain-containing protein [Mycobacterium sp. M23085]|uniref:TIR domain-containing protein n=1 Tax=Mycobacterium sp. M23085 TaxID=3378087 RepID=UPI0038779831